MATISTLTGTQADTGPLGKTGKRGYLIVNCPEIINKKFIVVYIIIRIMYAIQQNKVVLSLSYHCHLVPTAPYHRTLSVK